MKRPPRLRWTSDADDGGGILRPPWTSQAMWLLGTLWNGLLAIFVMGQKDPRASWIGYAAAAVFFLLYVRGIFSGTRVRFDHGRFTCVRGPIFPRARVEHEVSDIAGFVFAAKKDGPKHGHDIFLETRSGARIQLPLVVDGPVLQSKGGNTAYYGAAPESHADFVCGELIRQLEEARHRGGSYRVAPGADEATAEADDPDSEERRRKAF